MIDRIMLPQTADEIEDELDLSEYGRRSVPEKARIDEAAMERHRQSKAASEVLSSPGTPPGAGRRRTLARARAHRPWYTTVLREARKPAATPAPGPRNLGLPLVLSCQNG